MLTTKAALHEPSLSIPIGDLRLVGELVVPVDAIGIVVFAHGSGSGRHSPRNQFVADALNQSHLATLLFDLLTEDEEHAERYTRHLRFDIPLLSERLIGAIDWLSQEPATADLPLGCFGASTGAAAALIAAAERADRVATVVSRGGRPDLAGAALGRVRAAVLLIVGGNDFGVIELNEEAQRRLHQAAETQMEIVPGATHLFEEPGTLEEVARLAADWFRRHLADHAV